MKFDVARPHADAIVKEIRELNPCAVSEDEDITRLSQSEAISKHEGTRKTLAALEGDIQSIYLRYTRLREDFKHKFRTKADPTSIQLEKFASEVRLMFQALQPPEEYRAELETMGWFRKISDAEASHWEKVRASGMFSIVSKKTFYAYYRDEFAIACDFHNICYLKSIRPGASRPVFVDPYILRLLRMKKTTAGGPVKSFGSFAAIDIVDGDGGGDGNGDIEEGDETELDESDTETGQKGQQLQQDFESLTQGIQQSTLDSPRKKRRSDTPGSGARRRPEYLTSNV